MTFYRELCPALARAGVSVKVVEGSGFGASEGPNPEVISGVRVEALEAKRIEVWNARLHHLAATPMLRRVVAAAWAAWEQATSEQTPDLVEATDFGLLAIGPVFAAAPTIVQHHASWGQIHVHDPSAISEVDAALSLAIETDLAIRATAPQTYATANADYWLRQTGRNFPCFLPAWRSQLPEALAPERVVDRIAVFGRIQRWKGPHVVCEALRLMEGVPPVVWHGRDVIVESNSTDASLREAYPDVWGPRVVTHTPVSPERVAQIQASSRLNLIASTWDVFNFTVVEGMYSGRPVVCSDAAGASELIEDGVTGFVYDGSSAAALAEALRRALALPDAKLVEIGAAARESVSRQLDPERAALERIDAYQQAIEASRQVERSVPDWLRQIVEPRQLVGGRASFLEQQPLRDLASHVGARILRRIGFPA